MKKRGAGATPKDRAGEKGKGQLRRQLVCHNWEAFVHVQSLGHVQLFVTPWTIALQSPLSLGFSRQGNGAGSCFFLQGIFPTQGSNLGVLHWQVDFFFYHCTTWEAHFSR